MFHILVVDDDKNTRKFMRTVLEVEGVPSALPKTERKLLLLWKANILISRLSI